MNNGTTIRELSSVGSERLPYKQRVGGSTPSAPTKKDLFRIPEEVFFVRPARTYSKGCKSLNRPDSGKVTAKGKGVRRETESEGSRRQTSGLTDRNPI